MESSLPTLMGTGVKYIYYIPMHDYPLQTLNVDDLKCDLGTKHRHLVITKLETHLH